MAGGKKSDAYLAGGPPIGTAQQLDPIGVPPDYVATRDRPEVRDSFGLMARKAKHEEIAPRYFEGADWKPANWAPAKIRQLQQDMIAAGLLPKGAEIRNGYWDDNSRAAFRQLLAEANSTGYNAQQQLKMRIASEAENKQKSAATSVYLRPDPATLRSTARQTIEQILGEGHKATDQEIEHLSGVLGGYSRSQFDANVTAEEAAETATGDMGATTVQDVDPTARLEEYVRTQYRPEIKHNEQVVDMSKSRESLLGNVFALDQYIES